MQRTNVLHPLGRAFRRRIPKITRGATLLIVAVIVCLVPLAAADSISFPDVPSGHPYFTAIIDLATRNIIGGFADGTFGPGKDVTRQQFAKMAVLTGGYPVSEADVCTFVDVPKTDSSTLYPDNYIAVCAAKGITTGKTATTFDPGGNITRYQMISMTVRMAMNLNPGLLQAPAPGYTGSAGWGANPTHGANALLAESNGLLDGLALSSLDPNGNMTRGEVAQVLHNLLAKLSPPSTGWEDQDGVSAPGSGPAVASWASNRLDVFVRGADNALWWKVWNGSTWGTWTKIGGILTSDPAAVSWGPNRIDVFVKGVNDHLYHIFYDGTTWSAWQDLGGVLTSAPAAIAAGPGLLGVTVRGPGNILYAIIGNGTTWSAWGLVSGLPVASAPATVANSASSFDLFATGFDYALYHAHWNGTMWSTLESLGGVCASGPAVASWGLGNLNVFVRGPDNFIYQKSYNGAWSTWSKLAGTVTFQGDPDAVSWGPNRIDVFATGTDFKLYHKSWTGANWVP